MALYYRIMINSFSKEMSFNKLEADFLPEHESIGFAGFIKSFKDKKIAVETALFFASKGFEFPLLENSSWWFEYGE